MPQRLTKSSIYSRSLGLAACASLESKNEVCLLCEVNPKQILAFDFICASLESISAIEDTFGKGEGLPTMAFYTTGWLHDLANWSLQKWGSAITYDCNEGHQSGRERLKKLQTTRAALVGIGIAIKNPILINNHRHEDVFVALMMERAPKRSIAPNVQRFHKLGWNIYSGPKESGIEDFSCCVVSTVMSTGGTIVASREDVMGFFAENTTSNNLPPHRFKQKKGISPKK
ncbi:hypothetical protein Tco_0213556 [Tanacetum coccineum]